jgi:hypothetical protein
LQNNTESQISDTTGVLNVRRFERQRFFERQFQDDRERTDTQAAELALKDLGGIPPFDEGSTPKVAFIFLAKKVLENEDIWDQFFQYAKQGQYSIYFHFADDQGQSVPLKKWGAIRVSNIPSAWCALSGLEVGAIAKALTDRANTQFVFVSGDALPLKPFSYVYSHLVVETPSTSKICYMDGGAWDANWQKLRIWKHHQWLVLSRDHARGFVENFRSALAETYAALDSMKYGMRSACSDEVVVSTALLRGSAAEKALEQDEVKPELLKQLNIERSCLTWVYWRGGHLFGTPLDARPWLMEDTDPLHWREHDPLVFTATDQMNTQYLTQLVTQEGFMFARKFDKGAKVDNPEKQGLLAFHLPLLWKRVDAKRSLSRIWSSLDSKGKPPSE